MTKLFADRLAEDAINVFEIRPGIIATDMTGAVKAKYDKLILEDGITPIKRWGTPDDVGLAVDGRVVEVEDLVEAGVHQARDVEDQHDADDGLHGGQRDVPGELRALRAVDDRGLVQGDVDAGDRG